MTRTDATDTCICDDTFPTCPFCDRGADESVRAGGGADVTDHAAEAERAG